MKKSTIGLIMIMATILSGCVNNVGFYVDKSTTYANIYAHNDTSGITVSISDITTYFNLTNVTEGETNKINFSNQEIIIENSGYYSIDWSLSFSGGGNQEYQTTMKVNEVPQAECESHRKTGNGGDVGYVGGNCIIYLSTSDILRIGIKNTNNPPADANVWAYSSNFVRLR